MTEIALIAIDQEKFKAEIIEQIAELIKTLDRQVIEEKQINYLSRIEAAKYLNVSPSTLFRWTKQGKIPCYGLGNKVYYKQIDLQESLELNLLNND